MEHTIEEWSAGRAGDLATLVTAAMPGEELSEDELVSCCWDDPPAGGSEDGAVLALADGSGAVSVVWRPPTPVDEAPVLRAVPGRAGGGPFRPGAYVKLIAVVPEARRRGRGHVLLAAAEAWAWDHGAREIALEGSPPFFLWPGIDATATEALCLADARGYEVSGTGLNLSLPTGFRAPSPEGVVIRRVIHDDDAASIEALVADRWPHWADEMRRAVEHGCCHGAFPLAGGPAIGFVCHSVSRAGWLGPMGTDPDHQHGGVGRALLSAVCRDLMIAEMPRAEICWAGPLRFYAKNGATVSRVFRLYRKPRP